MKNLSSDLVYLYRIYIYHCSLTLFYARYATTMSTHMATLYKPYECPLIRRRRRRRRRIGVFESNHNRFYRTHSAEHILLNAFFSTHSVEHTHEHTHQQTLPNTIWGSPLTANRLLPWLTLANIVAAIHADEHPCRGHPTRRANSTAPYRTDTLLSRANLSLMSDVS